MAMQDKLKSVRAIRKWLEKAENSYTDHKDISGELNLIMAQAEMQRLKETEKPHPVRIWGKRGLALFAALSIVGGGALIRYELKAHDARVTARAKAAVMQMFSKEKETDTKDKPQEIVPAKVEEVKAEEYTEVAPAAESAEATDAPVPAPVMSESEIASVVGEAGRALRGQ